MFCFATHFTVKVKNYQLICFPVSIWISWCIVYCLRGKYFLKLIFIELIMLFALTYSTYVFAKILTNELKLMLYYLDLIMRQWLQFEVNGSITGISQHVNHTKPSLDMFSDCRSEAVDGLEIDAFSNSSITSFSKVLIFFKSYKRSNLPFFSPLYSFSTTQDQRRELKKS